MNGLDKQGIVLIGPAILQKMQRNGCFANYDVLGEILSLNPLSLYTSNLTPTPENNSQKQLDISKTFIPYLKSLGADKVFVNLEFIKKSFFYDGQNYYTQTSVSDDKISENAKLYEPTKFGTQIDNYPDEAKIILDGIRRFAKELSSVYRPDQIVLMSCLSPRYYITANNLVPNYWFTKYNKFLDYVERVFCDETNCFVWDFPSKLCPLYKMPNNNLISNDYFTAFYEEARRCVELFNTDKEKSNLPSLKFFIDIFKRINNDVINKKYLKDIVSSVNNNILNLTFDTSTEFVERFYYVFSDYYLKNASLDLMIAEQKTNNSEIYNFLNCYQAILNHDYFCDGIIYNLMFKYKFNALSVVIQDVTAFCEQQNLAVTVTKNNLAYYYAYMQVYHKTKVLGVSDNVLKSLDNMILFSNNPHINISPIKVDVWGACISRFTFNADEKNFKVNKYLYHVDPLAVASDINIDLPEIKDPTWEQTMTLKQFGGEKKIRDFFADKSDWIILDNFFMTAPNHFAVQDSFIQSPDIQFAIKTLGLEQEKLAYFNKPFESLMPKLNRFIQLVRDIYGTNIIFIKQYYHNYYIDASGKIQDFSFRKKVYGIDENDADFLNNLNELSEKTADYICNSLGCYVIDIAKHFLPDERSMSELHHLHYEKTFFIETAKIVKTIVENQPTRKVYKDYSYRVRVERYINLASKNAHSYIKRLFNDHWLDEYMLKMPLSLVVKYKEDFITLYKKPFKSFDEYENSFELKSIGFLSVLKSL